MPDPVDIAVGEVVGRVRRVRGLTQTQLADRLGLTFQQIQKYEKGTNRIPAGRLARIGAILDVPADAFFEDISSSKSSIAHVPNTREALEFARVVEQLSDKHRLAVGCLIKALETETGE